MGTSNTATPRLDFTQVKLKRSKTFLQKIWASQYHQFHPLAGRCYLSRWSYRGALLPGTPIEMSP